MEVPCDKDQIFERLFILGDTNFHCTVHLNDTVKATSESDINGVIYGFMKEFFTCKILNEYKVALSNQWVSVTILLRRNFRETPKHCPWDYLLFVSKSDNEDPAFEQANGAECSDQLQIHPDNTLQKLASIDHHASLPSSTTEPPMPKHGQATCTSQVSSKPVQACSKNFKTVTNINPVEAKSQQIVSADGPGQICSDKTTVGNCSVIIAEERSACCSHQIAETEREMDKNSFEKVLPKASNLNPNEKHDAESIINGSAKAGNTERISALNLTKLSSLLSETNGEAPFDPDFETIRDTCAWLCNNEIHLVMTDSSLECASGSEQGTHGRVLVEEERNDSVNNDQNLPEDSKSVVELRDRGRMYRAAKSLYNRRSRRLMQTRNV